tara:strand:+ start:556 stop:1371 length:816 start_codon:yes stop_codon:yes gene_type:complete
MENIQTEENQENISNKDESEKITNNNESEGEGEGENKKIEFNDEDKRNIMLIMDKHNLDEDTTKNIYLAFNKNIFAVLKYISNEIDNLKIICNQTSIDIEKAREIYYKCNKDVVESISFILEDKHEEEIQQEIEEENIVKPLFDESKTYKHIIECGKDLLYDEDNDYLFDPETKDFFSSMKSAKTKIQELRYIVDSKDIIIQNQKKTMKKEKLEDILNNYQEKLMEWGKSQLEKWETDQKLKDEYPDKDDYKNYLEKKMKLKYASETSKYY